MISKDVGDYVEQIYNAEGLVKSNVHVFLDHKPNWTAGSLSSFASENAINLKGGSYFDCGALANVIQTNSVAALASSDITKRAILGQ